MATVMHQEAAVWKPSPGIWAALLAVAALVAVIFADGILNLFDVWQQEEYSYGYLIPFIALYLAWQRRDALARIPFEGSWAGVGVCALGVLLGVAGELSAVYIIVQYALVLAIAGAVLALVGARAFREIRMALLTLLFMVPLPGFIYGDLSNRLQLVSSQLGVWVIQLFGISVYLEGNVIDLGALKLQVVEACSGLRYLFPLMTFGFILAYFFRAPWWKRAIVFVSTVPITILMNSFRIGAIGILVEYFGEPMARGFLHDFEGWAIFMVCTVILLGEIWLLARIGPDRRRFGEALNLRAPRTASKDAAVNLRLIPAPFLAALGLLAAAAAVTLLVPRSADSVPPRRDFAEFPLTLPGWQGRFDPLDAAYIGSLNFDDYIMANYAGADRTPVNFYVGYYASQNTQKVPHSPRACIPAGGWEIMSLSQRVVDLSDGAPAIGAAGRAIAVNSVIIQKGKDRQLVYYWFQQRGRVLTNEFLVKWFIFWDELTQHRSDGALIRVVTPIPEGSAIQAAHDRLRDFVAKAYPQLDPFVPGLRP